MKKYYNENSDSVVYAGETADIKAMYKSIVRNKNTDLMPLFSGSPRFSDSKRVYGLNIDESGHITIINSDCLAAMILDGDLTAA